jgi:hypothetical protein
MKPYSTFYTYKEVVSSQGLKLDQVQRIQDGTFIPMDEDNVDYQECLYWLEQGNKLLPADTPIEGTK